MSRPDVAAEAAKRASDARITRIYGVVMLVPGVACLVFSVTFVLERLDFGRINLNGILCTLVVGLPLTLFGMRRLIWPERVKPW